MEPFPEKLLPWFALKSIRGIGNILYKRLLHRFSSPKNVFAASFDELITVSGISEKAAVAIKNFKSKDHLKKEIYDALHKGFQIVTFADRNYPRLLRHIPDPPPYLYVAGNLFAGRQNIAVVGSRNPTSYGLSAAGRLAESLVKAGFAIISGMARGIDSAAHQGALSGEGKTIAVLGSGLAKIYPPENRKLFQQISENGAVISEFPIHAAPEAHHFPVRNRIISGMALGTVVVEASRKSGSLITARLALEQNREVFAVPGSIQSFKSSGTNSLIKQGAILVEQASDIVEELFPRTRTDLESLSNDGYLPTKKENSTALNPDEKHVVACLEPYPIHIDELVKKTKMAPGKLAGILLKLELEDLAEQTPGKCFLLKTN